MDKSKAVQGEPPDRGRIAHDLMIEASKHPEGSPEEQRLIAQAREIIEGKPIAPHFPVEEPEPSVPEGTPKARKMIEHGQRRLGDEAYYSKN